MSIALSNVVQVYLYFSVEALMITQLPRGSWRRHV